ncbi:uncharacterized protein LOC124897246 [Capsicum annuum]|uniref:uncharacterized protein LOC124897246 n=1 Tax=Capsicum annuum TaxID=4072 RepID=UPI001FB1146E|nr:uncharacterized protein LOC124897246 [Capsicum annuum]
MEGLKFGIEKFDRSNFDFWKMQIEDYLYQKDLHEPLTGVKPESMTEEKWKLKDRKELFQNFKSENFGKVYLADNKPLEIKEKGDVCIKTPAGNQWTLEDVRYIPSLKKNLISVGRSVG